MPRLCIILAALLLMNVTAPASAQDTAANAGPQPDSASRRYNLQIVAALQQRVAPKPLSWKPIVIPAALITYGSLSTGLGWFDDVNLFGRRWASDNEDPDRKTHIDDYTQVAPAIAVYGLHTAGIPGKNNLIDASLMYAISLGIANAAFRPLKIWSAELRPDSSDNFSFPSGHTATAFVSAEFLRQEYKHISPWIGAGGYAVAILTGYLRMYNNKHWFSDVAAGAGIGILSTRISYWLYPKLKNVILGKSGRSIGMVSPFYQQGIAGVTWVQGF